MKTSIDQVHPGVWRIRFGEPEEFTPTSVFKNQPQNIPSYEGDCPISPETISAEITDRGILLSMPLADDEQVYGLGLQLLSFNQRGKKKTLRVNSDPLADTGDSHAPVPFFVTTKGCGVFIDTLRYMTVYCGGAFKRTAKNTVSSAEVEKASTSASGAEDLYSSQSRSGNEIIIELPRAKGVDIYLFAGPSMPLAVARYNQFSGGGCLPPMWGLGVWYRCKGDSTNSDVLNIAEGFRKEEIPCDVLGIEPGWQSHAYSCTYVWSHRFPEPQKLMQRLSNLGIRTNLWTHAFIHPDSPIRETLEPHSGDYLVWDGLVPDFSLPEARRQYADFFEQEHIEKGASGYKLDECDNSDFIASPWSFPEFSHFPSGMDGEQMHSAFGMLYQQTIQSIFNKRSTRTYGEVRSSWALAAPMPYVLYSDLYDHKSFIRGVATSGFSGLLWCPEVRHAESAEDLIRRIQSVVFSPQALVNAWYIKNPPWQQWETEANNAGELRKDREWVTDICRRMFTLRMQFLPYLYSAFMNYHATGMPPFRALVMDYPDDQNTWIIDDEYIMGDRVLVAPLVKGETSREVYLPQGEWLNFWTADLYEGSKSYTLEVPIDRIPVFVKNNSLLPLAQPVLNTEDPALFDLTVHIYGSGTDGIRLYEDDGKTNNYKSRKVNHVALRWASEEQSVKLERTGNAQAPNYQVRNWQVHNRET